MQKRSLEEISTRETYDSESNDKKNYLGQRIKRCDISPTSATCDMGREKIANCNYNGVQSDRPSHGASDSACVPNISRVLVFYCQKLMPGKQSLIASHLFKSSSEARSAGPSLRILREKSNRVL